ncbi:MAG: Xaa-Pro peptidase family protein [Acidilobaceae archaeon]
MSHKGFSNNRSKLKRLAEESGLVALVLAGEPNLVYTLGLKGVSGALVLSERCGDYLLVPLLDYTRTLRSAPKEIEIKTYFRGGEEGIKADVPSRDVAGDSLVSSLSNILKGCEGRIGLDSSWIRADLARELEAKIRATDVSDLLRRTRAVKESWEVELIEEAARIAEETLRRVLASLSSGVTETELAGLIDYEVKRLGGWKTSFEPIVAFYSNTAYPHHVSSQTKLSVPGPVLIDLGAISEGYSSDLTRSFWWGSSGNREEYRRLIETLIEAQEAAIDVVAPGVEAWEPDNAARRVLEKRGLSRFFVHGVGHGVGIEIHEEPYLRPGSKRVLEKNMVVTVEPGVYIEGVFGARVEDLVLVTEKGRKVLTRFAKVIEF